jgi:hypothetical protein
VEAPEAHGCESTLPLTEQQHNMLSHFFSASHLSLRCLTHRWTGKLFPRCARVQNYRTPPIGLPQGDKEGPHRGEAYGGTRGSKGRGWGGLGGGTGFTHRQIACGHLKNQKKLPLDPTPWRTSAQASSTAQRGGTESCAHDLHLEP